MNRSVKSWKSVEAAQAVIMEAASVHLDMPLIPYNLACYSCALGNLEAARMLLARAFAMNEYLKKKVLDDPDLEPLWAEMGSQPPDTRS